MEYGKYIWVGASGKRYTMEAFSLETEVRPEINGNYIFGELYKNSDGTPKIRAIYIGEGNLRDRIRYRIEEGRVQKKGCNCFCAMINEDEQSRKAIESDLLAANENAYEPIGCNIRIGG